MRARAPPLASTSCSLETGAEVVVVVVVLLPTAAAAVAAAAIAGVDAGAGATAFVLQQKAQMSARGTFLATFQPLAPRGRNESYGAKEEEEEFSSA